MSKSQSSKKKGTPITWDELSKFDSGSGGGGGARQAAAAEEEQLEEWEKRPVVALGHSSVPAAAPVAAAAPAPVAAPAMAPVPAPTMSEADLKKLTWDEQQEMLATMDDEEAKKSPYYCDTFDQMGLNDLVARGIYSYGFDKPSRVQARGIKVIASGRDCIIQAQSGTGKTGTFVIGLLQNIDYTLRATQVIVLSPTRELADQTYKVLEAISQYCKIKTALCVGQVRLDENVSECQVVVCTTGRVVDCIERKLLNVAAVRMMIIDEADEMLSQGFKEQVEDIYSKLPKENLQVCLLSATLSPDVMGIAETFMMRDPLQVLIKQEVVTLKGISQFFVNCIREDYKLDTLMDIYTRYMCTQSIVYVSSKQKCCWLASELIRKNHTVLYMDSSMTQRDRSRIMREFRNGTCRILITTNLLSRGIDVQGVNLVINYDLPGTNNIESYVHRIGRCGRYGRKGVAINFITPNDFYIIQNIRKYYSTEINELPEDISGAMTY
jgi:superfamily II DNA/RNA helicase